MVYVIDDAIKFLMSDPRRHRGRSLLARRLYYTTSSSSPQQQAAGKREDLDLVDRILAQLVQKPDDGKGKKKK